MLPQPSLRLKASVIPSYLVSEMYHRVSLKDVLDRQAVSQWIKTTDQESFQMSRRLIRTEGLMCGGSSGAVVVAAIKVAKELQLGKEKTVLVVLPDTMRNYLSKVRIG